jgi:hypothetical protein
MIRIIITLMAITSFSSFAMNEKKENLSNFTNDQFFKNEIKIHTITPRYKIRWSSPRSLGVTSLLNSIKKDYAPIGHFAVEINCEVPNRYGIKNVLTGMERLNKKTSNKVVFKKKLGLGSLFYAFEGDIQSAETTLKELKLAQKDKRLTSVTIPTSAERCQNAMDFLEHWIESGSYTVYGGNKDVRNGEGSGCADFALKFFLIATSIVPREDLMVRVRVPNKLIGDGENKKIRFFFPRAFLTRGWSNDPEDSTEYVTPDTNRVIEFIRRNVVDFQKQLVYTNHLDWNEEEFLLTEESFSDRRDLIEKLADNLKPYEIDQYNFTYQYEKREASDKTWKRVINPLKR